MQYPNAATAPGTVLDARQMSVRFVAGEAYEVQVRGHRLLVDQPAADGGDDNAPTPTELFVASLATCVAFYAGRYLDRHGFGRDGLAVTVDWAMATDRPARVASVTISVRAPEQLAPDQRRALLAVASNCTVHHSISQPPAITVDLA